MPYRVLLVSGVVLQANSLRYPDFNAMYHDLDFQLSDFTVAAIAEETRGYDEEGNRKLIDRQRGNVVLNAFKHMRRAS